MEILAARPRISGARIGRVVAFESGGEVLVDFPGNAFGPCPARLAASLPSEVLKSAAESGTGALLVFEGNDPRRPVLVDLVREGEDRPISAPASRSAATPASWRSRTEPLPTSNANLVRTATIDHVGDGIVFVDIDGIEGSPRPARTTVPLRNFRDRVLVLLLPDGAPVIVGQLYPAAPLAPSGDGDADILLRARRVRIEAESEIELVAGRTRIHLDARGKVSTVAEQVVSRARGTNKIQGGSVQLN